MLNILDLHDVCNEMLSKIYQNHKYNKIRSTLRPEYLQNTIDISSVIEHVSLFLEL